MTGFVQIIEFTTSQPEELRILAEQYRTDRAAGGAVTVERGTFTADRDRPNTYLNIVEFASYEDAKANSEHPATTAFAQKMSELCDGPPKFYNLDVREVWTASS